MSQPATGGVVTPRGFRDVLFDEAEERRALARSVESVFASWGYRPVETPVVERVETLRTGGDGAVEEDAFRFFDGDGGLLALRREMTVPIARLVASRLDPSRSPYRVCYEQAVFREHASYRGQSRQFTQLGVELIGVPGPEGDTETIAVMVDALAAAGLADFRVGVGTVEILRALMDAADRDRVWDEATTAALHERNLVELDRLVAEAGVGEQLSRALRGVPRLQGGREAIGECRALVAGSASTEALDRLERTFELLETCGAADRVWLDFGILRSFDYYTGVVLEAFSPGLGLPLGGGGRYDGLLAEFSSPSPAAGFALGLERLQVALSEQRRTIERPEPATLLGGEGLDAFRAAQVLRDQGERVVLAAGSDRASLARRARAEGTRALWASEGGATEVEEGGP